MSGDNRVGYEILANKFVVAGFLKDPLPEDVIQKFEDESAKGRQYAQGYIIHVDRTVRKDATVKDFHELCLKHFTAEENPYYPYFWVVLDARTAKDGTVLVYHDRQPDYDKKAEDPPEELRANPSGLQVLLSCLDVSELTISDILINDRPDDEVDTWVYDVPFDHSEQHQNARVAVDKFESKSAKSGEFTILHAKDVSKVAPNFDASKEVEVWWFGKVPEKILLQVIKDDNTLVTYAK